MSGEGAVSLTSASICRTVQQTLDGVDELRGVVAERTTPGLRSAAVRRSNLSTIIEAIHLDGVTSRSDLVSHTGLTRSSVGALVGELVELGLVREERAASDGSPGRPSAVVKAEGERNAVLAIEILVDSIAVAAVGLGGTPLRTARLDRRRDRILPPSHSLKDVARLVGQVTNALRPDASIYAIGIAIPGLVRRSDNVVVLAPNLGWHDVAIVDELQAALGSVGSRDRWQRGGSRGLG